MFWLGIRQKLQKLVSSTIRLGNSDIVPSTAVRNLGVIFDSELNLISQVNAVTRSSFYQIRQLRSIRRLVSVDAAKTFVNVFISSRVNYCNSVYYGATDIVHKICNLY